MKRIPAWVLLLAVGQVMAFLACGGQAGETTKPDCAAILRELWDTSREGISRLGPDYAFYQPGGGREAFPRVWMAPSRQDPGGSRTTPWGVIIKRPGSGPDRWPGGAYRSRL